LQTGPEVTQIYSDWQTILDILDNENFLSTNVKVVFDARAQECTAALDLVVGQIP
jgi:hypothetical protein